MTPEQQAREIRALIKEAKTIKLNPEFDDMVAPNGASAWSVAWRALARMIHHLAEAAEAVLAEREREIAALTIERDKREDRLSTAIDNLRAQWDALVKALERCNSNRGCFSTVEPHDLRCPKARADSPEKWKGEWLCKCGREELDAALAAGKDG